MADFTAETQRTQRMRRAEVGFLCAPSASSVSLR